MPSANAEVNHTQMNSPPTNNVVFVGTQVIDSFGNPARSHDGGDHNHGNFGGTGYLT